MTYEEEAIVLSKAVLILDKYGYIQTFDIEDEAQCAHFKELAMTAARNIQKMAREK